MRELIRDRKSLICVSIDPALPGTRDRYVIPERYVTGRDDEEAILDFTLDIIDKTYDKVIAYKLNLWYMLKLSPKNHKYIANYINKLENIPILDCKINDIGDTVEIGITNIAELGYKMITINPLLGNLHKIVNECKNKRIGSLVLTLTSNRESERYLKNMYDREGRSLYVQICRDIIESDADGCVVGVTDPVTVDDICTIRSIIGKERIIFIVGVGAQGGDICKIEKALPGLIMINIGRDIIYSDDPRGRVDYYNELFSKFLEKVYVI